ncbi:MAG: ABC transporter permease [Chloroflexota bacterium]|nr:ABC transporter permease [Chloroflexota bacterium]
MTETNKSNPGTELEVEMVEEVEEEMRLDDARRVKVLSPGMLVFKRFIRNKLAVIGLFILVFMFSFSFLGPLFMPYEQAQVFVGLGSMSKDYAGAIYNEELRFTVADDGEFTAGDRAQFLLALSNGEQSFESDGADFYYEIVGDGSYIIAELDPVAEDLLGDLNPTNGNELSDELLSAYAAAVDAGEDSFTADGTLYRITQERKVNVVSTEDDVALATLNVYDAYDENDISEITSLDFLLASESAISNGWAGFMVGDQSYSIENQDGQRTILDADDEPIVEVSNIIVNPLDQNEFLSVDFKSEIRQGILNRQDEVLYTDEEGETIEYTINRVNQNYYIRKETPTTLIRQYEAPSVEHPLGLDNNGMDVMTRLMYGGQVSLLVGFVVVIIEVTIGVIVGGVSGYFGGAVDTTLMRFVDLFNSIPFYPMVIIFGSVMDTLQVDARGRIFLLMMILGILGWTGVARVVRGQILSLREQDFMVATEATGIRTSRRIFRHLVPNVMPLLIVQATASLGGIIIAEATLGFLGLGVKYPLASWGSIINVASDAYVMTNFWFMWIPAGLLILLTVLGFNFVGDGLRDAFDPRMRR